MISVVLLSLLLGGTGEEDFDRAIKPIVTQHCLKCHSGEKPKVGLNLSTAALALTGSKGGPVIVPGNAEGSLMVQVLAANNDGHMPPEGQLTPAEIEAITNWVKSLPASAAAARKEMQVTDKDREHWSFRPLRIVEPPNLKNSQSPHPIDRFLLAKLESQGLVFASPADPRALIRRLSFTLIGLPPTPEEVDSFCQSAVRNRQSAIIEAIDRLLASPHYGERWARHWLDVARFADVDTSDRPEPRPDANVGGGAYHYRDYVIRSMNADKPFNRFLTEQIAGDLIAPDDREAKIATAFLRLRPLPVQKRRNRDSMISTTWFQPFHPQC